jgi:hypothetical protein
MNSSSSGQNTKIFSVFYQYMHDLTDIIHLYGGGSSPAKAFSYDGGKLDEIELGVVK